MVSEHKAMLPIRTLIVHTLVGCILAHECALTDYTLAACTLADCTLTANI